MRSMQIVALALASAVPFGLAALETASAQSVAEKTGLNSVIGVAPTTADFVKEAASSDMFEIQSSQLALERADAPTKAFANQMIADHQKTTTEMTGMIQSGKLNASLPTDMLPTHRSMMDTLRQSNGADFTKRYHDDQVTAHKSAVSLYQRYGKGGESTDLKAWANNTLPTLQHHLEMAQDLDKAS